MTRTLNLPAGVSARLLAEAARRGLSVEDLIGELVATSDTEGDDPLEAFIGSGRSGRADLARRYREIEAEITEDQVARDP